MWSQCYWAAHYSTKSTFDDFCLWKTLYEARRYQTWCFQFWESLDWTAVTYCFLTKLLGLCLLGDLGLDHTVIYLRTLPYSGPFVATLSWQPLLNFLLVIIHKEWRADHKNYLDSFVSVSHSLMGHIFVRSIDSVLHQWFQIRVFLSQETVLGSKLSGKYPLTILWDFFSVTSKWIQIWNVRP